MNYEETDEFKNIKQQIETREHVKNHWMDFANCQELINTGKKLAETKPLPKIAYCFMCLNRLDEMAKAINAVKDHVDKIVAVDGGSVDNTIEYLQNIEKCDIVRRKWSDEFDVQRNQYLNHVLEKYPDYWVLVSDTDEWYCEDLMKNLKFVILALEELKFNRIGFMCWFKMVASGDSPKNFDKVPEFKKEDQGGMQSTFYKKLCFKAQPGMAYIKSPHEGLLGNWKVANLANLNWYFYHVKTRKSEVERGCRNYFIAGPQMRKTDLWQEFRTITDKYNWKLWSDMNSAMIKGDLADDILKWIWSRKDWQKDGPPSSEQREYWLYYYEFLHPDKIENDKKKLGEWFV